MHGTVNHNALAPYLPEKPRLRRTYPDLQEHVMALAEAGLLVVVDEPVNKDRIRRLIPRQIRRKSHNLSVRHVSCFAGDGLAVE
jgi:hypothetical protein